MKVLHFILPLIAIIFSFSAQSQCVFDSDCDDGIICTADICNAPNCINTQSNALCDDGFHCTTDVCSNFQCVHTPNNAACTDGNPCNGVESCNPISGCQATPFTCDDGSVCNGLETCNTLLGCQAGTPLPSCDDGDPCNGLEFCNPTLGCRAGTPVTTSVSITSSTTMPNCNGAVQTITFTANPVNGGVPVYQWKKNGNNVGTNSNAYASATLLNGDQVRCEMTSNAACVAGSIATSNIITVAMFNPPVLTITTTTESSCCNGKGTALANPSNGNPPYTYRWNNNRTTQLITSLYRGAYRVTVTDAAGCTATTSASVNDQVPGVSATISLMNLNCQGNPGSITVNPAGGQSPYTFRWSNGSTSQTINNLSANSYSVTVTDSFMCNTTTSTNLAHPPLISISANITNATCNGQSDGSIQLTVTGGAPGYSYIWNTGATSKDLNGIPAGNYFVTVTDANGCTATTNRYVSEPAMSISVTCTHVQCNGRNDGSIQITVNGGTPGYSYLWNTGATTKDLNNIPAGIYYVTATDVSGCSASVTRTVIEPYEFIGTVTTQDVSCFGGNDGTALLYYSGGTGPYSLTWSNGAPPEIWWGNITNLSAGTYCATATDAHNCSFTACGTVSAHTPPVIAATATPSLIQLGASSNLNVTGCTGCTYVWAPSTSLSNSAIQNPLATPFETTDYDVTATNANGCSATATALITVEPGLLISGIVRTETGGFIPGVLVDNIGTFSTYDVTIPYPSDGQYSAPAVPNDDYIVIPTKDNDINVANGISTIDILRIRSHILGNPLTSPYKIIAADVNESGSVTTSDLLQVRALVLGNIHTFPNGRLWAFVNSDFVFANPLQPFPYEDYRGYLNLSSDKVNQDFIGIKLGDVNNNWNPATPKAEAIGNVQFTMDEHSAIPGSEVFVPVRLKDFRDIAGYQFTLAWDASVLSLLEVNNKALTGYYGELRKEEGLLTTTWYEEKTTNAITLDDDVVAFELRFKAIGASGTHSEIKIGSELTVSEAYNENLDLLNIVPTNGIVKVGDEINRFHPFEGWNLSVQPNPFSNSTNIIFSIPQDEAVSIVIYDLLGKEVKKIAADYKVGEHSVEWAGNDDAGKSLSKGLYHVRMVAGDYTGGVKAVLVK